MKSSKGRVMPLPSVGAPSARGFLQRTCACGGPGGLSGSCSECEKKKMLGQSLQTKLRINEPGDEYEQEADRVADQVLRMPGVGTPSSFGSAASIVQRRLAGDGTMLSRATGDIARFVTALQQKGVSG